MKMALRISLVLNLALLAGLVTFYSAGRPRREDMKAETGVSESKKAERGTAENEKPKNEEQETAPFYWKQLYAPDYHDYVKNLRAVGCPEGTVRAIVTADVHVAYSFWAKEIEQQIAGINNGSWTNQAAHVKDEAALKDQLARMPDAETAEIADLLGLKPAPAQVATDAATTAQPSHRFHPTQLAQPISQPLVFQDIDLSTLNLTEEQKQAIANIRQDFQQQVGGANQDPNDPAYLTRWQQAQPAADDLLKAYLGGDTYAEYEVLATQKTLADQARGQQQ